MKQELVDPTPANSRRKFDVGNRPLANRLLVHGGFMCVLYDQSRHRVSIAVNDTNHPLFTRIWVIAAPAFSPAREFSPTVVMSGTSLDASHVGCATGVTFRGLHFFQNSCWESSAVVKHFASSVAIPTERRDHGETSKSI